MITLAAMLSLSLPLMPVMLYRHIYYEHISINNIDTNEDPWELATLPTILGWVDIRRFVVFAYFQHVPRNKNKNSQDSWKTKYSFFPDEIFESLSIHFINKKLIL